MRHNLLICVFFLGCTGPTATGDDDPDPDAGDPEGYVELIAGDWEIAAGDEVYLCVTRTVDEDTWVTSFRPLAPDGTHHTVLTVGPPDGPDRTVECGGASMQPGMLYGSGVGTDDLVLPAGTAVRIRAGQQLSLNLHLFNAGTAPLGGRSGVLAQVGDEPDIEAGAVLAGDATGRVVPLGEQTLVATCVVPVASEIHRVMPHMHTLGTHLKTTAMTSSGERTILDVAYSFDEQRYYPVEPAIAVEPGDEIRIACTYDNTTGEMVPFGESTTMEMCLNGLYTVPTWGFGVTCQ